MWCLSASKLLMSEKGQCQSCPYWKNGGCSWTDKHDTPPCDCWVWDGSRPSAPRWINVKDELPELDEKVVVYATGRVDKRDYVYAMTSRMSRYLFNSIYDEAWRSPWGEFFKNYEITHWMPLPEPPKEDE